MSEQHVEFPVLGKVIGTATGWDQLDNWKLMFYAFERNALGCRFVPAFPDGADLVVDFDRGVVSTYDAEGNETTYKTDWSVFNTD